MMRRGRVRLKLHPLIFAQPRHTPCFGKMAEVPGCAARAPRRRDRRSVEAAELAMALPGGHWRERGAQLLLHVLTYIHFLQLRIQETQNRLVPHSGRRGFLPLWMPKCFVDVAPNTRLRVRRRRRPRGPEMKAKLKTNRMWRQRLVPYVSSSSSDNSDGGPWLVPVSPGSPHSPCTPQCSSAAPLELSPLQPSPADGFPFELFGEVEVFSWAAEDIPVSAGDAGASFSLDHSYQSCGKSSNCPLQEMKRSSMVSEFQEPSLQPPGGGPTGSGFRRCMHGARSRARKRQALSSTAAHLTGKTPKLRTPSRVQQLRKKCVNGFIMFCRLNRRPYLSAHPGKASTTATKDLAELWRVMSARERHPYCIKALHFSLLHDRLVRSGPSALPHEHISPPKPLSVLLAEKASRGQELGEPPCYQLRTGVSEY